MITKRVVAGVAVATVAGGAVAGLWQASRDDASDNVAFVDVAETTALVDQVTIAVGGAFSVSPGQVEVTRRLAAKVLAGDAVAQYDQLYGPTLDNAASRRLTLSTSVRGIGVEWLRGSSARLLVFADQSVRTRQLKSRTGAAQLVVEAHRVGDTWKLVDIKVR